MVFIDPVWAQIYFTTGIWLKGHEIFPIFMEATISSLVCPLHLFPRQPQYPQKYSMGTIFEPLVRLSEPDHLSPHSSLQCPLNPQILLCGWWVPSSVEDERDVGV